MSSEFKVRLMESDDYDAVIGIDRNVTNSDRTEYYDMKFSQLFETKEYLPTSLVAENKEGKVVGFIMAELYMGEYGITSEGAALDTIGIDPSWQKKGIGELLLKEFFDHLQDLGVLKINALVSNDDSQMMRFFSANNFKPSTTIINMERNLEVKDD
ncbi:MAG: GNAT family N-acetyltransferase [Proteobacteria bacterium]|nr:GNAT family N-acetyltransferase [Pseudomonadota bacterium]